MGAIVCARERRSLRTLDDAVVLRQLVAHPGRHDDRLTGVAGRRRSVRIRLPGVVVRRCHTTTEKRRHSQRTNGAGTNNDELLHFWALSARGVAMPCSRDSTAARATTQRPCCRATDNACTSVARWDTTPGET